jgi:hypothetical protein
MEQALDAQHALHVALTMGVVHGGKQVRLLQGESPGLAFEQCDVVAEEAIRGRLRPAAHGVTHHGMDGEAKGSGLLHQVPAYERGQGVARAGAHASEHGQGLWIHVIALGVSENA